MKSHRYLALLLLFTCGGVVHAEVLWKDPVRRKSVNRFCDVLDVLIERQRFDEAAVLCHDLMKEFRADSDEHAFWAIRLSRVLSAKSVASDQFDASAIQNAQHPVAALLQKSPNHARHLFLKSQELDVTVDAARHAVVLLSVSPTNRKLAEAVSDNLAIVSISIKDLIQEIDDERVRHERGPVTPAHTAFRSDLVRLHQEKNVDLVSLALLQTGVVCGQE